MTDNWSKSWNNSKKPSKQRKYRRNAPQHVKEKLISANVSNDLRDDLGTRNIKLRTGDQIKVMRGDFSGETGIVNKIDFSEQKIYVDGMVVERQNGTESQVPIAPSNVQVVAMNVDDDRRMEKFDVDRDDFAEIEVDEEEMEEALEEDEENEMMKQMQSGDTSMEDIEEEIDEDKLEEIKEEVEEAEEDEEAESEDETEEYEAAADYSSIVDENIGDAKDQLNNLDEVDWEAALEAEKEAKNRKTFVEWLENKAE